MLPGTRYPVTTTLVTIECYKCAVLFGIPAGFNKECLRDHNRSFYCPNGHDQHYVGETQEAKLRRQLKWAEDQAAAERARADGAEASLRTTKGHVTRLRKHALEGECPICGKHVYQLERHVKRVHSDEPAELAP